MDTPRAPYKERLAFFKHYHASVMFGQAGVLMHRAAKTEEAGDLQMVHCLWTAFYVMYAKPFRHRFSTGIRLSEKIVPVERKHVHDELLKIRDKLVAHSDIDSFQFDDGHPVESIRITFNSGDMVPDLTIIRPNRKQLISVNNLLAALNTQLVSECAATW